MKIRSKLKIIYILPVLLTIVVVFIFFKSYKTISRLNSISTIVERTIEEVLELNVLTADYLRHPSDRPKVQWTLKYTSIAERLDAIRFERDEEKILLNIMRDNHGEIKVLFEELVAIHDKSESLHNQTEAALAYEERLIGQILIRSQALVSSATKLGRLTHEWMMNYYLKINIIIMSVVGLLMLFIFTVSFLLGKSIAMPITRLREATEIIAGGNLDLRTGIETSDELGQLGRSFDEMTIQLKKSRAALESEISERKKAEEELKRYQENLETIVAERTGQLKDAQDELIQSERLSVLGKLSSSLAHEINNPLGVIDSSVYYLKMKLKDADEKTLNHLDRIKSQVDASNAIIESLRNLTRLKMPSKVRIDIADSIKEGMIKANIPDGVNVVSEMKEGKLLVDADREQLVMVFRNLTENAVQAMEQKGTLWVNAFRDEDNLIEVSFRDLGPGIAPDYLEKIFQPFFTTKAKGIGFGLALCRIIVERHGGTITAISEQGKGATFTVRLPASETNKGA